MRTQAKLKAAENLLAQHNLSCPSSPVAALPPTAATDAMPGVQILATQSVLDSPAAQPQDELRQRDSHTAAAVY